MRYFSKEQIQQVFRASVRERIPTGLGIKETPTDDRSRQCTCFSPRKLEEEKSGNNWHPVTISTIYERMLHGKTLHNAVLPYPAPDWPHGSLGKCQRDRSLPGLVTVFNSPLCTYWFLSQTTITLSVLTIAIACALVHCRTVSGTR